MTAMSTGLGDPRITCRAQGSRASASSKPELRLPMMKMRLPWYSRGARASA